MMNNDMHIPLPAEEHGSTVPAADRFSDAAGDGAHRLTMLLVAVVNAAFLWAAYMMQISGQLSSVKAQLHVDDILLYVSYVTATSCGGMALCAGLAMVAARLTRPRPWIALTAATGAVVVIAALLDMKIFSILGVHFYDPLVLANMTNEHIGDELRLGLATTLTILGLVAVICIGEVALVRLCRNLAGGTTEQVAGRLRGAVFGSAAVVVSSGIFAVYFAAPAIRHDNPVLGALPLYEPLFAPRRRQLPLIVDYPGDVPATAPRMGRTPDILVLMAESFRADVVDSSITPHLADFAHRRATIKSRHHDAGCHVTEYGVFSTLYGLQAHHYSPFLNRREPSYALEVLKANGYQLTGTVAAHMSEWNYAEFLFDQFDTYREFTAGEAYDNDRAMVEWIKDRRGRPSDRPRFMFAFFNSTHHNYVYPPEFERRTPVLPDDHNYFIESDRLADQRELIFNRYLNSAAYIDALFGELVTAFDDDIAAGELVVLFTGDHGEEFWEHGLLGHSATRFVDERTRVPLVFALPGTAALVPSSSHADIMPTLFDYVGLTPAVPHSAYSNGRSLLGSRAAPAQVTIGAGYPMSNDYLAIRTDRAKHWLRKTGPAMRDLTVVLTTDLADNKLDTKGGPDLDAALPGVVEELYRFLDEE